MKSLLRFVPPMAAAAVVGFLLSANVSAADKAAGDSAGKDHAGASAGHSLEGRIESVSAANHQIMLTDVKWSSGSKSDKGASSGTSGSTDAGRTTAADRGNTGTNQGNTGANRANGAGDRSTTAADRGNAADKAGEHGMATVQVAENAKITLDGKAAELSDLKAGMYARVYIHRGAGAGGADKGATSERSGSADRDRPAVGGNSGTTGANAGAGSHLTTNRIEAHTKKPADAGGNAGTKEK